MDRNLKREIILEHYQNPYNKGYDTYKGYIKINNNSQYCIDNLDILYKIEDNKIMDIKFDGEACAISTAATSIMIKMFVGKDLDYVKKVLLNYYNMIEEKDYDKDILEELIVFDEIYKQANRKKCALLPMESLYKVFDKLKEGE